MTTKFDVRGRYSLEVQFTAEIDCEEGAKESHKLGLAVLSSCAVKPRPLGRGYKAFFLDLHTVRAICKGCNRDGHIAAIQRQNKSKSWLGRSDACGTSIIGAWRRARRRSRTAGA